MHACADAHSPARAPAHAPVETHRSDAAQCKFGATSRAESLRYRPSAPESCSFESLYADFRKRLAKGLRTSVGTINADPTGIIACSVRFSAFRPSRGVRLGRQTSVANRTTVLISDLRFDRPFAMLENENERPNRTLHLRLFKAATYDLLVTIEIGQPDKNRADYRGKSRSAWL